MRASPDAFELIKHWESLRLKAYKCSAGKWTIGYGSTWNVIEGMTIGIEEARGRLVLDVIEVERGLRNILKVPIEQYEYDALVSFAFNFGIPKIRRSSLIYRINNKDKDAALEFDRWVYVRNPESGLMEKSDGLINRRRSERLLFETGVLPPL